MTIKLEHIPGILLLMATCFMGVILVKEYQTPPPYSPPTLVVISDE